MKYLLLIALALTFVNCGVGDTTTYVSQPLDDGDGTYDENGTLLEGMVVDDVAVSDVTNITDVQNIEITEDGIFIICTAGSTCSVDIDNSVNNINTDYTFEDNSTGTIVSPYTSEG